MLPTIHEPVRPPERHEAVLRARPETHKMPPEQGLQCVNVEAIADPDVTADVPVTAGVLPSRTLAELCLEPMGLPCREDRGSSIAAAHKNRWLPHREAQDRP